MYVIILSMIINISIHAPVKGATHRGGGPTGRRGYFNPRTREGCDQARPDAIYALFQISIHAPVKGATPSALSIPSKSHHFNPRTREGCDDKPVAGVRVLFQISIHAPVKGATNLLTLFLP